MEKYPSSFCLETKYDKENTELKNSLKQACNCINNLPQENEKLRLPIFATKILNNPHGLDRKNLTGKLFITLLTEKEEIKNNHEIKKERKGMKKKRGETGGGRTGIKKKKNKRKNNKKKTTKTKK